MEYKIFTATICLFLLFGGIIGMSGQGGARYGDVSTEFAVISIDETFDERRGSKVEYNNRDSSIWINQAAEEKETSSTAFTRGIYDFLGWIGSNIQDFLAWSGSNIWDFLAWAGSNMYSASASLGMGGIVLLLVVLMIMMVYAAIMI